MTPEASPQNSPQSNHPPPAHSAPPATKPPPKDDAIALLKAFLKSRLRRTPKKAVVEVDTDFPPGVFYDDENAFVDQVLGVPPRSEPRRVYTIDLTKSRHDYSCGCVSDDVVVDADDPMCSCMYFDMPGRIGSYPVDGTDCYAHDGL